MAFKNKKQTNQPLRWKHFFFLVQPELFLLDSSFTEDPPELFLSGLLGTGARWKLRLFPSWVCLQGLRASTKMSGKRLDVVFLSALLCVPGEHSSLISLTNPHLGFSRKQTVIAFAKLGCIT